MELSHRRNFTNCLSWARPHPADLGTLRRAGGPIFGIAALVFPRLNERLEPETGKSLAGCVHAAGQTDAERRGALLGACGKRKCTGGGGNGESKPSERRKGYCPQLLAPLDHRSAHGRTAGEWVRLEADGEHRRQGADRRQDIKLELG